MKDTNLPGAFIYIRPAHSNDRFSEQFDVLTCFAAEEFVQRCIQCFTFDIPESDVDRAKRVKPFLSRRIEPVHKTVLPDEFRVERVLPNNAPCHVAHGVRRSTLSDTRDAGFSIDEHDHVALGEGLRAV